jgi:hypothetical protein
MLFVVPYGITTATGLTTNLQSNNNNNNNNNNNVFKSRFLTLRGIMHTELCLRTMRQGECLDVRWIKQS